MLRTKADVDRHVQGLLRKVKSDNERNLRCFNIAQLYFKVQDYESARHYVSMYLSVRCDSPSAHKLLGQALEHIGLKEKALAAYKKSLELEANQADLVLKMCELLCDKEVVFDPAKAHYWAERASTMFPHSPVVFMLKEKLLSTGTSKNCEDFENLFQSELKARPTDTAVRVKLLKLYVETDRVDVAYNHAFEIEFKQEPSNHIPWYHCLNHICDAYLKAFPNECNWEFYVRWLSAVDRLCSLCMSETLMQPSNLVESTEVVYNFDQVLYKANQLQGKSPEFYKELVKHFSAQLAFHTAVLLLKRAKKESSLWKEVKRMVSPLLLFSSNEILVPEGAWNFMVKDNYQKFLKLCTHHAQCRVVQAGHVLCSLSKDNHSEKIFLDKVTHFTSNNNWRNQIFQKVFRTLENNNPNTSHLVTANFFNDTPRKLPSNLNLKPSFFVPSFEITYMGSLHHLVWLGLQSLNNSGSPVSCKLAPSFYSTFFKSLHLTTNNLHNTGVETLNQLDVDSFLYAAVFCAGAVLDDQKSNGYHTPEKPHIFPPDITPLLCTTEQAKWWTNACSIVKVGMPVLGFKSKVYDIRHNLQRGIEVVRGEGIQLALLVSLARTFSLRASEADCDEEKSKACESRALHLWRIAIPQLEKLADFEPIMNPGLKLFEYPIKDLTPDEVNALLEEGRFFIACHYTKIEQYEHAIETFKKLRTPQSLFHQALIYQKLAKDQLTSLRGEEITSEIRSRHVVMATKARDCLYSVRDMIKGDRNHPLQQKLKCKLMEIDDLLSRFGPENDVTERDGYLSDTSPSFASGGSPTGETTNIQQHMHSHSHSRNKHFPSSTPNKYYDVRHRSSSADIAELLTVNLNTSQLKTQQFVLEQSRLLLERLDNMKSEQRAQRSLLEDLANKFVKLETEVRGNLNDIKKEINKRPPDLYNMLDEEDYNDDMLHYSNIPFYPAQRGVQGTNTVTYGAPVAPFFSPRVEQVYPPNNVGFYNPQGTLPFPDGQQVSDFLRTMPPPPPQMAPSALTHKLTGPGGSVSPLAAHKLVAPPRHHLPQVPTNVVITTSDTLPTGAPPVQPTLSVTIPPQHRLGTPAAAPPAHNTSLPHNFQIAMPADIKTVDRSRIAPDEDLESDEETVEHDPIPDFRPIIPLPEEVDVKTGEENEEVLFESRAKLFRYIDKQWKERGVGTLKILRDASTNKCRILMRRDQVHKVCANHIITPDMNLEPFTNKATENAWIWFANDFADEKVQLEHLCAKFKTTEDKLLFKSVFDSAKAGSLKENKNKETTNPEPLKQFLPSGGDVYFPGFLSVPTTSATSDSVHKFLSPSADSAVKTNTAGGGGVVNFGGFTLLAPPKLKLDDKKEDRPPPVQEEKKPENPLANFSFKFGPVQAEKTTAKFAQDPQPEPEDDSSGKKSETRGGVPSQPVFNFSLTPNKTSSTPGTNYGGSGLLFGVEKKTESPFGLRPVPSSGTTLTSLLAQPKPPEQNKSFGGFGGLENLSACSPSTKQQGGQKDNNSPRVDFGVGLTKSSTPNSRGGAGFEGAGSQVFGGSYHQSPNNKSVGSDDDFTPTAEFKPVIPLPKLVEVKSGEENETVLYVSERAKLLRFCKETKQWKERGTGQMKILRDPETGAVRLLMRREQVLKVCCNHRLASDMLLKPLNSSDRSWTWVVPQDFSDETPTSEIFALKFKNCGDALKFKDEFDKAQESLKSPTKQKPSEEQGTQAVKNNSEKPSLSAMFKPRPDSWECQECFVRNGGEKNNCEACGSSKPGSQRAAEAPQSLFGGGGGFSFGAATTGGFSFGAAPPAAAAPTFTFGAVKEPAPAATLGMGLGLTPTLSLGSGLVPTPGLSLTSGLVSAPTPGLSLAPAPTPGLSLAPTPGLSLAPAPGLPLAPAPTGLSLGAGLSLGPSLSLGPTPGLGLTPGLGVAPTSVGGGGLPLAPTPVLPLGATPGPGVIGAPPSSGFVFGCPPPSSTGQPVLGNKFAFGSQTFHFTMPANNSATAKSPLKSHDESGSEHDGEEESVDNISFTPAIPLPEEVPLVTGEENEDVLYIHKAKLFRYDSKSREWKERGIGEVKILQHSGTRKIRLLMRREHVMKLCLNHYITPELEMKRQDDKSWCWSAADYSDGDVAYHNFALRFKTPDIAAEFKAAFDDAMAQSLSGKNSNGSYRSSQGAATVKNDSDDNIQSGVVDSETGEPFDEGAAPKNLSKFTLTTPREDVQTGKGDKPSGREEVKQSDDDLEIVYENDVSEEDKAKALALKLPPKFYLYKNAPPCPGCVGCDPQDDETTPEKATTEKDEGKDVSGEMRGSGEGGGCAVPEVVKEAPAAESSPIITRVEPPPPQTTKPETPSTIFGNVLSSPAFTVAQTPQQPQTNLFGNVIQSSTPKSFFPQGMMSFTNNSTTRPLFGNNSKPEETTPTFKWPQPAKGTIDFSDLSKTSGGSNNSFSRVSNFQWPNANSKVFDSPSAKTPERGGDAKNEEEEGETKGDEGSADEGDADQSRVSGGGGLQSADNSTADEHDPHFEPVIPLPKEIEIKTGEEDEDILFSERGKLYRHDKTNKEWKERGAGNFKILKHRTKNTYRFLMRRELVHKVVCNHLIMSDLELKPMSTSETSLCWSAMNLGDDYPEPQLEFLAIRFKNRDITSVFKQTVNRALEQIALDRSANTGHDDSTSSSLSTSVATES